MSDDDKERAMPKSHDLTGQRFGRLTVVCRSGTDKHRKPIWSCNCECGNKKDVVGANLRAKKTSSCGCLNVDIAREKATAGFPGQRGRWGRHFLGNFGVIDREWD